jgi:hypothetical protein
LQYLMFKLNIQLSLTIKQFTKENKMPKELIINKNKREKCRMNFRLIFLVLSIILLLLIISPLVSAIGVTPGRTNVEFSPSLEREVSFSIVNTEHKNMNVAFTVSGELKDYVSLDNDAVSFTSGDGSKDFKYKVKLPDKLSPGLHIAEIEAIELPENINDVKLVVKATVSVVTQVYVYVPYPGKYIDVGLDIVPKEGGNKVNFYIPVLSRGEEKINSVKGVIDIYKGDNKITSINTNEVSLALGERKELSAEWEASSGGEYDAKIHVNYDGEIKELEKSFTVGNESFGLLGVSVNDFKLGDVAKIRILVQNKLSDPVKDAYATLAVYDTNLQKIADLKSENYEIPALSNKEIIVYWDTEKLNKGNYDSDLGINYKDKFIVKNLQIAVTETSMTFSGTGFAIAANNQKLNINSIYYIIIGVLVLVNIAWLVWWMRNKKKKVKEKNK